MDTLKMKLKLHGLEFEIEGNEATVKEEFANFKAFVTGDLLSKVNIVTPQVTTITPAALPKQLGSTLDATVIELGDFPAMKEIVKRDLPKSESDWVLIYCLYSSNFGENPFTESDIKNQYDQSGRKNTNRLANFSNNIKKLLNSSYIKVLNDTQYILKDEGLNYAKQVLSGQSTAKASTRVSTRKLKKENNEDEIKAKDKKTKPSKSSSKAFIDLSLPSTEIDLLIEFFKTKKPQTQNEKIAVVMKWYKDHINSNEIGVDEINYLMSICDKVPSAIGQVLINMKGSNFRWVSNSAKGKVQLTSIGETYVTNKLPKTDK